MLTAARDRLPWCFGLLFALLIATPAAPGQVSESDLAALIRKADALREQGRTDDAIRTYREAISLAATTFGMAGDPRVLPLLRKLAALYEAVRKPDQAEHLYLRCVQIEETRLGRNHPDVAPSLEDLALFYRAKGEPARAAPLYERVVRATESRRGPDHVDTASVLNTLANTYREAREPARALPLYERALAIREARLGKDHEDVAAILNNLANLHVAAGDSTRAEKLYRRCLQIYQARRGLNHPDVAAALNNLATLYDEQGRYGEAEPLYRRSLDIRQARLGPDHPDVARTLGNLASLYRQQGDYARAAPLYERSLQLREAKLGKDHPDVAVALNSLASLHLDQGQLDKAEPLFLRSRAITEKRLGTDHLDTAATLGHLGSLYRARGDLARAESFYRQSLQIREAKLGKSNPDVAAALHNLANVLTDRGDRAEAEQFYRRSLQITEARFGGDHPDAARTRTNLAMLHAASERWEDAAGEIDRARRAVRRHAARVLPAWSEAEQMQFLRVRDLPALAEALSLGVRQRDDPRIAALSASWLINGKGVAQQAAAERALLTRDGKSGTTAAAAEQLRATRQRLAELTLRGDSDRAELARLAVREQELTGQLGRAAGRARSGDPWIELADVRQAVPADAVLVEFARVATRDFAPRTTPAASRPAHYIAWVVPPRDRGQVRIFDLGNADVIEAAILSVRRVLQSSIEAIRRRAEAEAETEVRRSLEKLSQLVLRPLLPHLGEARQLVLSPDAQLWLVPWCSLPLPDGRFALEQYQLRYVVSGRDLLNPAPAAHPQASVVLADPDYDLQATSSNGPQPARTAVLQHAVRLPGTAREAEAIAPALARFTGANPVVLTGVRALEGQVKQLQPPRVLVLCTHGFFLEDPATAENPLLRCGVLLAGCNQRAEPGASASAEDGVLTGLEIVGCDLRGCELVVLSACDTGIGEVRNGEGVAGLRQAFQLAGARNVVASLWQVPDNETSQLMTAFFEHLADGRNPAAALRDAQLRFLNERRAAGRSAHPFLWAAFTLTGS